MTVPITIDATRHLLYDNQSKTFLGVGANYDRNSSAVDEIRVFGQNTSHYFVLDEARKYCDVYTYSGYKLELYWYKETMDKRWRELRAS